MIQMILFLTFYCKFCFRLDFITPTPMTNIHISFVYNVNNSSVKNIHVVYDSIQTGTDTIPFGTVSIIYVSDLLCDKNK